MAAYVCLLPTGLRRLTWLASDVPAYRPVLPSWRTDVAIRLTTDSAMTLRDVCANGGIGGVAAI